MENNTESKREKEKERERENIECIRLENEFEGNKNWNLIDCKKLIITLFNHFNNITDYAM